MADHDKDAPNTSQFQAPHDTYASSKPPTAEHSSNQYSSSNMNPSAGMGSANPYGPGPHRDSRFNGWFSRAFLHPSCLSLLHLMLIKYKDTHNTDNPINTGMGNMSSHSNPDTYGSTAMGGDGSTNTTNNSSSGMNAGPHKSKLANKMDPRVDSDMGKPSQIIFTTSNLS